MELVTTMHCGTTDGRRPFEMMRIAVMLVALLGPLALADGGQQVT
jgi:hypothetical protein